MPMVSSCMYFNFVNVTRIDLIPTIERDFVCIVMDDGFFFSSLLYLYQFEGILGHIIFLSFILYHIIY